MLPPPLVRLQCGVNSYEWGKVGSTSAVAQFAAATPAEGFSVQDGKPYAELWMGTHPSNPSRDVTTGRTLLDLIESNATLLSTSVTEHFGKKLPFLFKILSINKALSIQAHPNKKLAEQLHARDPAHYPDDNHKPEMAIAITNFEGLCGFRPVTEIAAFLLAVDGFRDLVGVDVAEKFIKAVVEAGGELTDDNKDELKGQLKAIFGATMKNSQDGEKLQKVVEEVLSQVRSEKNAFAHNSADERAKKLPTVGGATLVELIERTHKEFGVDVGTFMLFFLNYVTLTPGEALFLVADDIHAYISGDIVECMAASDNVVRAGFTPKFKDVNTLVNMLTYNTAPIEEQKMVPTPYAYATMNAKGYSSGSTVVEYNPPIDEFSVAQIKLVGPGAKVTMERVAGPSILIATSGKGSISVGAKKEEMDTGYVFFVGADAECVVEANVGDDEMFIVYRAFCEIEDKKEQKQE